MGCFLACYGCFKSRKRRKPANKILIEDRILVSYKPLESTVSAEPDPAENSITTKSELRSEAKEPSSIKIRKKVRFNLNVVSHEPVPYDEEITCHFLQSKEEKDEGKGKTAAANAIPCFLARPVGDSTASRMGFYPSYYRYENCRDSYDEEDELEYDESDSDYYDADDDDDYDGNENVSDQEEFSEQFNSVPIEPQKRASLAPLSDQDFPSQELNAMGSNQNARYRSQYIHSVRNPVENLTQWKAVKARAAPPPNHQGKENITLGQGQIQSSSKPCFYLSPCGFAESLNGCKTPMQNIVVDASLSNWLSSSETIQMGHQKQHH
ncbi:uncharacterized protein LOC131151587 [Malania oleifera]|uniref:uncharacterized protein LOC131151587 n=1 Tax=Malania oleifera TaxID=397392 RepID=UPI0025ADE6F4|nr:uncharacterized protein LOC131151587 [Malania oleifera]